MSSGWSKDTEDALELCDRFDGSVVCGEAVDDKDGVDKEKELELVERLRGELSMESSNSCATTSGKRSNKITRPIHGQPLLIAPYKTSDLSRGMRCGRFDLHLQCL
jgi:hypothetical protein